MKKILSIIAIACVMLVSFSSCKEDTEPRIGVPSKFELNTPPLASSTYILTPTSGVELSWSQPDYAFGGCAPLPPAFALTEAAEGFIAQGCGRHRPRRLTRPAS